MQGSVFASGFYRISEWIMRLTVVNLLWLIFTLIGGIIFGIGPSTVAMFSVIRKWVMGEGDVPILKTFWNTYRREFKKANLLMICLLVIGYILYLDLRLFQMQEGMMFLFLRYLMIGLLIILSIMVMYVFPLYVHFELKVFQYFRNALLFAIMHPLLTILMGLACIVNFFILYTFPFLFPFFGGSLFSFVSMALTYRVFVKLGMVKQQVEQSLEEK